MIPSIETSRLRLRGHTLTDFAASAAMWTEPAVVQFISGSPSSESQSWSRFLSYAGHWSQMRFGYWLVEEKATGRFVGEVGFADFKRDLQPSIKGVPEMGWVLSPSMHGKGYATEAIQAALAWGEENLTAEQTISIIAPDNEASIRVAIKLGFVETNRTIYMGKPVTLYSRLLKA